LLLASQTAFYLTAFAAWILEKNGVTSGIAAIPLYFVLANAASVIAFYKFLRGERYARWEPIRDNSQMSVKRRDAETQREIQTGETG
jgi:hypothetical protein